MKRRGFLGFIGGAAVAGPSMAKQAVTALSDTALGQVSGASVTTGGFAGQLVNLPTQQPEMAAQLASLVGRTMAQHREEMVKVHVHQLDPDIAEFRAVRLQSKIRMQRERDYWRHLANEKSWLQRAVQGLF